MCNRLSAFEVFLKGRGRRREWSVYTTEGTLVMRGESRRTVASYEAQSALLLLLLSASYPGHWGRAVQPKQGGRPRRSLPPKF